MAFHTSPAVFQPYDANAITALKYLGYGDTDSDYVAYMRAFHRVRQLIEERCARDASVSPALDATRRVFQATGREDAMMLRITDKYLWKVGDELKRVAALHRASLAD